MAQHTLLLVESDPQHLRVMEVSLRKAGYQVTTARDGAEALSKLSASAPDLIVADTALANVSGFELCERVKQNATTAGIPFIFLTKDNSVDGKVRGLELGAEDYLIRPVYTRDLADRIRVILGKRERDAIQQSQTQRRFFGDLANMSVVDLMQAMELGGKSGSLKVESNSNRGTIWFRDGQIIDANAGTLQGADAVYRMLTWDEGSFETDFRAPRRPVAMSQSTQNLLMEGLKRTDDWGRIAEQLPSLDTVFTVDYTELSEHIGELEDDVSSLLRLFDGQRSAREVVAAAGLPDLDALDALSLLYFQGIIAVSDGVAAAPSEEPVPAYEASIPPAEKATIADALLQSVTDAVIPNIPSVDPGPAEPPPPPTEAQMSPSDTATEQLIVETAESAPRATPPPASTSSSSLWELSEAAKASQQRADSAAASSLEMALMRDEEEVFPEYDGAANQVADLEEEDAFFSQDDHFADDDDDGEEQPFDFSTLEDEEDTVSPNSVRVAIGLLVAILVGGAAFVFLQDKVEPLKTPPTPLKTKWTENAAKKRDPVGSVPAIKVAWEIPSEPDGGIEPAPTSVAVPSENSESAQSTDSEAGEKPKPSESDETKPAQKKVVPPTKKAKAPVANTKPKKAAQPLEVPKVDEKSQKNARGLTAKAIKLYKRGKYKASVVQFEKALAQSPGSKAALVGYTKALLEVNRVRDALEAAEKASRIDNQNAEVFLLLGNARQELGMAKPSIKAYERYLKLAPSGRYASEVKQVIKGMKDGL